jgi:hypothetical protein
MAPHTSAWVFMSTAIPLDGSIVGCADKMRLKTEMLNTWTHRQICQGHRNIPHTSLRVSHHRANTLNFTTTKLLKLTWDREQMRLIIRQNIVGNVTRCSMAGTLYLPKYHSYIGIDLTTGTAKVTCEGMSSPFIVPWQSLWAQRAASAKGRTNARMPPVSTSGRNIVSQTQSPRSERNSHASRDTMIDCDDECVVVQIGGWGSSHPGGADSCLRLLLSPFLRGHCFSF